MVPRRFPFRHQLYLSTRYSSGFSLLNLLITLSIIIILAALAYPSYHKHILQARLHQAQADLLINGQYLAKHYQHHISYRKNGNSWPTLPITQNQYFCFRFQGNPRFTREEHFTLKAVALNTNEETRILKLNQDGRIIMCQTSSSRCDEEEDFFHASRQPDLNCQIFNQ
ncbi:hypothetical protein BHC53_02820 [Snodgrassella alvi]|nr:hypothetical protein BHC53_02820 [Snodgrassella alvi]